MATKRKAKTITGAASIPAPPKEPQSICLCKHTGDGPNSEHAGLIGHGTCLVTGCGCQKFTWDHFTEYGRRRMNEIVRAK